MTRTTVALVFFVFLIFLFKPNIIEFARGTYDQQVFNYADIEFPHGSSTLTEVSKKSIDLLILESLKDEYLNELVLLSWSDNEYPEKNIEKLSSSQRQLASKRMDTLSKYIKLKRNISIEKYNMAEKPSRFSKLFNTADNKLKSAMLAAGLPTTNGSTKYFGKASHAIIVIKSK